MALEAGCRPLSILIATLNERRDLMFNMDSLTSEFMNGLTKFISSGPKINKLSMWSSLLKIEDVDDLLISKSSEYTNLIHTSTTSFYERINKFKKENTTAPFVGQSGMRF
jgi:hypothetical protein